MDHKKTCPGCLVGNPYLCYSFPGIAPAHAERERQYQIRREKRLQNASKRKVEVYYRDEDLN